MRTLEDFVPTPWYGTINKEKDMALRHTITTEGTDGTIPVGEIEAFVGRVNDAGSGVHQPVTITAGRGGKVTLSVELSTEDKAE